MIPAWSFALNILSAHVRWMVTGRGSTETTSPHVTLWKQIFSHRRWTPCKLHTFIMHVSSLIFPVLIPCNGNKALWRMLPKLYSNAFKQFYIISKRGWYRQDA
jgi:hypothetical protein